MPRCGAAEILGYVPPELHEGKEWFIDFYAKHPDTGALKRKRIKVNRIKSIAQRRAYCRELIHEITKRLQAGWSPWQKGEAPQQFITLRDAMDQWERVKLRQLRHSSPYSYTSILRILRDWAADRGMMDKHVAAFTAAHASEWMYYLDDERGIAARTSNNYLTIARMVFAYFIERRMISANPFDHIRKQRPHAKSRTYLTEEDRQEMVAWMEQHAPHMVMPVILIYGALIRPGELRRMRVELIDIERQVITLPAEVTKTNIERFPAIPDWMVPYLLRSNLHNLPGKTWLMGPGLAPGNKPCARNTLTNEWVKMRTALGWPATKQLYSLRDTGIIQLLRDGVDLLHVMQQAGHTEIATTNKYLRHAFPNGPAEVREKATSLYSAKPIVRV